jgi:uncharacterized caspase-like protein
VGEKRVALIIGNLGYRHVSGLLDAGHDATAIATLFRRVSFNSVEMHRDLGIAEVRQVVREFSVAARAPKVIFFAGHGIEVDDANYLIPIDARLATEWGTRRFCLIAC